MSERPEFGKGEAQRKKPGPAPRKRKEAEREGGRETTKQRKTPTPPPRKHKHRHCTGKQLRPTPYWQTIVADTVLANKNPKVRSRKFIPKFAPENCRQTTGLRQVELQKTKGKTDRTPKKIFGKRNLWSFPYKMARQQRRKNPSRC